VLLGVYSMDRRKLGDPLVGKTPSEREGVREVVQ